VNRRNLSFRVRLAPFWTAYLDEIERDRRRLARLRLMLLVVFPLTVWSLVIWSVFE
jgi:hypothetical protein